MFIKTLLFIIVVTTISTIVKSQYIHVQQFTTESSASCDSNELQQGWISKLNVCSQYYFTDYLTDVPMMYVEESNYIVENQYESSDLTCEGDITNTTKFVKNACDYLTNGQGYNGDFKFSTMSSLAIPSNSLLSIYYRFPCGKSFWKDTFTVIQYQPLNVCAFEDHWNSTSNSCDSTNKVQKIYPPDSECTEDSPIVESSPLQDSCGGYFDDFNYIEVCNN